ncbi:MAG: YlbF family regulator [Christensenellales bacterium]|jgi:cell fate (sporulation/competence/biofilm development) regulator YlbF (YheA/YmcA/DUF963 family)
MDLVFQKTRELGQALLESEAYLAMQKAEDQAMKNADAAETISRFLSIRSQLQGMLAAAEPDSIAMKQLSDEMDALQSKLRTIEDVVSLTEARDAFNALIGQVNQVLQFIVTGNMDEGTSSGCSGGCGGCAGGCHLN